MPSPSIQNVDYGTQVPYLVYVERQSPPDSPLASILTENIANELNIKKDFEINKKIVHEYFYAPHNLSKKTWVSSTF